MKFQRSLSVWIFLIFACTFVESKEAPEKSPTKKVIRDVQKDTEQRIPANIESPRRSRPPREMIFRWNVELPGNMTATETAKILNNYQRIYIRSRSIPLDSEFSNSSILMYFRKNQLAMKFYTKPRQGSYTRRPKEICFVTQVIGTFNETIEELKARAKQKGTVQLGENAIIMTTDIGQKLTPLDLKALSRTVYVFCKRAATAGRAFRLIKKSKEKMSPIPFIGSGMVSPGQSGVSVPYIIEVDQNIKKSLDRNGNRNSDKSNRGKEAVRNTDTRNSSPAPTMNSPVTTNTRKTDNSKTE